MRTASDFVVLSSGLALPLEAVRLAWDLEERGLRFTVDGDELLVGPRQKLSDEDRVRIRQWKRHLMALLAYEPERVQ
jgi:hypothetical protein